MKRVSSAEREKKLQSVQLKMRFPSQLCPCPNPLEVKETHELSNRYQHVIFLLYGSMRWGFSGCIFPPHLYIFVPPTPLVPSGQRDLKALARPAVALMIVLGRIKWNLRVTGDVGDDRTHWDDTGNAVECLRTPQNPLETHR